MKALNQQYLGLFLTVALVSASAGAQSLDADTLADAEEARGGSMDSAPQLVGAGAIVAGAGAVKLGRDALENRRIRIDNRNLDLRYNELWDRQNAFYKNASKVSADVRAAESLEIRRLREIIVEMKERYLPASRIEELRLYAEADHIDMVKAPAGSLSVRALPAPVGRARSMLRGAGILGVGALMITGGGLLADRGDTFHSENQMNLGYENISENEPEGDTPSH